MMSVCCVCGEGIAMDEVAVYVDDDLAHEDCAPIEEEREVA